MKTTFNSQAKVIIHILCWKHLIWINFSLWEQSISLGYEICIVKIKQGLTDKSVIHRQFYIMVPENLNLSFDILTLMGRKAR